ncbi:hypothetical protein TUN199_00121 [Pyrenophora tritici-repentis]|uniref:Uncharacterized protein n=1 Tax=Pyrenophora tritici-repentis TaxID=45151 RepID=A0A922NBC6_9PLEO|nr:hypothetical protein TUN199_00121 [Pyrenophora tritici-repentis]KAI1512933.1 hypothetical protein Ptr86124_007953 [Pyrenophora tritici-repentis]KAI1664786.1 hypothetical protein L13192_10905 [Pyrenophora tritici-repentis]KAI1689890.1 hypothetical protein KJE20_03068 [Pyrenophora tritici-repentis]
MLLEASLHARCAFWLFLEIEDEQREGDTLVSFLLKPALLSPPTPTWTQPAERWCRPCLQACVIRMLLDQNTAMSQSLPLFIAATADARARSRRSASSTSIEKRRKL